MDRTCLEIIYSFKNTSSHSIKDLSELIATTPTANRTNMKRKGSLVKMLTRERD
jgi:hypothetical protein